jgi:hypothetical protein
MLNKITDLKRVSKGVNQKNKFYRDKAKLAYFAGR